MKETQADDAAFRQKIVGTWKLVSVVYEDQATKERTPVYGEHPKGFQIATPEGRWPPASCWGFAGDTGRCDAYCQSAFGGTPPATPRDVSSVHMEFAQAA